MSFDMKSFGEILGSGLQFGAGMIQVDQGAGLAGLGASISAQAYRNAGVASVAAANYKAALIGINSKRQLSALSYEMNRFSSAQIASSVETGADPKSKSYLLVMSETMAGFENMVLDFRASIQQQQEAAIYEGKAAEVMYENRARAAEYEGQLAEWRAGQAKTQAMGNMFGSILGGLGGGK